MIGWLSADHVNAASQHALGLSIHGHICHFVCFSVVRLNVCTNLSVNYVLIRIEYMKKVTPSVTVPC